MQLITDEFIKSLSLRAGAEALQADVDLLEQYVTAATGCGLESLDHPAGKLIESGLAARYPDHFKVGSGLEGIASLLSSLKKGLNGLKKMARGKAKPFLEKQSYGVVQEIKKTYMSDSWYKGKEAIGKPIDVSGLAKLIGPFTDYAGIATAIKADEKTIDAAFEDSADETDALYKRAKQDAKALRALPKEQRAEQATALLAAWKPLLEALNSDLPEIKHGSATKIDGLTVEQAKAVGDLMYQVLEWGFLLENKAEDVRTYNGGLGQEYINALDKDGDAPDVVGTLFWNCWYWESLSDANSTFADNGVKWTFSVAQQLEQLIINSVK